MRNERWQLSLVCVVLMALLAPMVRADVCGQSFVTLDSGEVVEVGLGCVLYGQTAVGNATFTLNGGALVESYAGGNDGYLLAFGGSIVDIKSGTIEDLLWVSQSNATTVYGSGFSVGGVDLAPSQTEIVGPAGAFGDPLILEGSYEDGSAISIPFIVESGDVLKLSWVGSSVIDVTIDIKPDSEDNSINLGSLGVVPVGILSTADFDATQVDPWSVELAGAGVAVRGKGSKLLSSVKDLNGDGLLDLEVKVETENLDPGQFQDGAAVLTGQTYDGQDVQGKDSITIVPE